MMRESDVGDLRRHLGHVTRQAIVAGTILPLVGAQAATRGVVALGANLPIAGTVAGPCVRIVTGGAGQAFRFPVATGLVHLVDVSDDFHLATRAGDFVMDGKILECFAGLKIGDAAAAPIDE